MTKILTIIAGGVGDCILYSPIFRAIKRKYPQSHVTCMVWSHGYPSPYRHNPFIDDLIEVSDFRGKERTQKVKKIIGQHFDAVYVNCHIRELYYLIDLITFDKFFAHYSFDEAYREVVPPHLLKLIDANNEMGYKYPNFDLPEVNRKCEVYYTQKDKNRVMDILGNLPSDKKNIVISLTSADEERTIPFKVQAKIIKDLSDKYNFIGVARFTLSKEDKAMFFDFHRSFGNNLPVELLIDTDDKTILGVNGLVALIEEADYYITPLSMGIALADCTKTPTITIMGYRPSIQDLIPQYTYYCPNILLTLDSLNDVNSDHIKSALGMIDRCPRLLFRKPYMMDYREEE